MRTRIRIGLAAVLCLAATAEARAQRYYPRGYGNYGWGGWGADPAAGYMAGLGAFARGQGIYELENAEAQALNFQTMQKWNQALRARQQELQLLKQQKAAEERAQRDARVERWELEDGTTLNNLLMQILEFDPDATRSARSRIPLGAAAVREIPFEWNTEAITICINQLTARDALPEALTGADYAENRAALGRAVDAALKEDARGDVSPETMRQVSKAVADFRAKFARNVDKSDPDYTAAYFNVVGSLSRLLHDPGMKQVLAQLDDNRAITVGDLIAFMQSYNLRFGPATNARQVQLYEGLVDMLKRVRTDVNMAPPPPPPSPPGLADANANAGKNAMGLQAAAKDAFKGMDWPQLEAHARQP